MSCVNNSSIVRAVAAAWALLCFVMIQSYNTTLISFLTSPEWKPIIESVYDIPKVPGLQITVDKGYAADFIILVSVWGQSVSNQSEIGWTIFRISSFRNATQRPRLKIIFIAIKY